MLDCVLWGSADVKAPAPIVVEASVASKAMEATGTVLVVQDEGGKVPTAETVLAMEPSVKV